MLTKLSIEAGLLVQAVHKMSPNFNSRPAAEVNAIIVHNISLPAGEFGTGHVEALFSNTLDCTAHPSYESLKGLKVSAHLLIKRCGTVIQFVNFDDRAWHAGVSELAGETNCNDFSIGIELEGCDNTAYSQRQYSQLIAICQSLMTHYPEITVDRIVGHNDIAPGRKTDPGIAFDWAYLQQQIN